METYVQGGRHCVPPPAGASDKEIYTLAPRGLGPFRVRPMISPQTVELEDLNVVQGSRLKAPVPTNECIDRTRWFPCFSQKTRVQDLYQTLSVMSRVGRAPCMIRNLVVEICTRETTSPSFLTPPGRRIRLRLAKSIIL